jgi:hypothetical protein
MAAIQRLQEECKHLRTIKQQLAGPQPGGGIHDGLRPQVNGGGLGFSAHADQGMRTAVNGGFQQINSSAYPHDPAPNAGHHISDAPTAAGVPAQWNANGSAPPYRDVRYNDSSVGYNTNQAGASFGFGMDPPGVQQPPVGGGVMYQQHTMGSAFAPAFDGHATTAPPVPFEPDRTALKAIQGNFIDASQDPTWQRRNFHWSVDAAKVNKEIFGNNSFRHHQLSIVNATMSNRDVFVLMPTGGGKSLCYQLPAVLQQNRVTAVISPLVSLIQDQTFQLTNMSINAVALNDKVDLRQVKAGIIAGEINIIFLTPEKLVQSAWTQRFVEDLAATGHLARAVIDEAHCVSQWGHGTFFV